MTMIFTALIAPAMILACGNSIYEKKRVPNKPSGNSDVYHFQKGHYATAIRHALYTRKHLVKGSRKYKTIIKKSTTKHTTDLIALKIIAASTIRTNGQYDLHTYRRKAIGNDRLKPQQRIRWATKVLAELQRTYPKNPEYQTYLAEAHALQNKTKKQAYLQLQTLDKKDLLPDADAHLALAHLHQHFKNPDGVKTQLALCEIKSSVPSYCTLKKVARNYDHRETHWEMFETNRRRTKPRRKGEPPIPIF